MQKNKVNISKITIVAVAVLIVSACVALSGCSGASKNFEGSWKTSPADNEQIKNNEIIKNLKNALGVNVDQSKINSINEAFAMSLKLESGNKATLTIFGINQEGSWDSKSPTEGTLTIGKTSADIKLEGNKLTVSKGNSNIPFYKDN